jgi:large subunit ribosomal protein L13
MILVNAEGKIMGRLASFVAKKAILGEEVTVVNAEKVILTGSKEATLEKFRVKLNIRSKGNPEKGPKFSRMPDRILRMSIRGMLPWKSSRGKKFYKEVHVYIGVPSEFEGKKFEEIPGANENEPRKAVELGTVCRLLGAKW